MDKNRFREKSIQQISAPEELNEYIQVARPGVWFVLIAIFLLIAGAVIWSVFGVMEVKDAGGKSEFVHPIEFIIN